MGGASSGVKGRERWSESSTRLSRRCAILSSSRSANGGADARTSDSEAVAVEPSSATEWRAAGRDRLSSDATLRRQLVGADATRQRQANPQQHPQQAPPFALRLHVYGWSSTEWGGRGGGRGWGRVILCLCHVLYRADLGEADPAGVFIELQPAPQASPLQPNQEAPPFGTRLVALSPRMLSPSDDFSEASGNISDTSGSLSEFPIEPHRILRDCPGRERGGGSASSTVSPSLIRPRGALRFCVGVRHHGRGARANLPRVGRPPDGA